MNKMDELKRDEACVAATQKIKSIYTKGGKVLDRSAHKVVIKDNKFTLEFPPTDAKTALVIYFS